MLAKRLSVLAGAAAAGGFLHALKGAVLLVGGADLSLVPAMSLLFAIGILGLHVTHRRLSLAGAIATFAAIVAALAAIGFQIAGSVPEEGDAPVGVDVAYGVATFAILVGLLLFAVAFRRAAVIDPPWSTIPLVSAVLWFPLEGLTLILPDGWGLLFAGLAWIAVAVVIAVRARRSSAAPSGGSVTAPRAA